MLPISCIFIWSIKKNRKVFHKACPAKFFIRLVQEFSREPVQKFFQRACLGVLSECAFKSFFPNACPRVLSGCMSKFFSGGRSKSVKEVCLVVCRGFCQEAMSGSLFFCTHGREVANGASSNVNLWFFVLKILFSRTEESSILDPIISWMVHRYT